MPINSIYGTVCWLSGQLKSALVIHPGLELKFWRRYDWRCFLSRRPCPLFNGHPSLASHFHLHFHLRCRFNFLHPCYSQPQIHPPRQPVQCCHGFPDALVNLSYCSHSWPHYYSTLADSLRHYEMLFETQMSTLWRSRMISRYALNSPFHDIMALDSNSDTDERWWCIGE